MAKWGKWGAANAGQMTKGAIKPADVEKIARREKTAKIIGIVSGKGGVGKTTVTSNLGVILARDYDTETLAIDANVLTSNLGLHLGVIHPQIVLQDVVSKTISLERAIYVHPSNLKVIPASVELGGTLSPQDLRQNMDLLSLQYSWILVDSAPGLATEALAVISACDSFLVITNPELPAITDAIKTIEVIDSYKKRILGVVVNKIKGKEWEIGTRDIEAMCGYPVISEIPYDEAVPESISNKTPVTMWRMDSPASIALMELAGRISGKKTAGSFEEAHYRRPGIFRKIWYYFFG